MAENNICILCLLGLPASGKTCLASIMAKHRFNFSDVLIFCYDELINWNKHNFMWKEERKNIVTDVENKILSFLRNKKLHESLLIILDDNMYYQSMRYVFYKLAKRNKIKFGQIHVDTNLITCLNRNSKRNSPIPVYQILKINEKLEIPSKENNWENNSITVSGEGKNFEKCLDKIKQFIDCCDVIKFNYRTKECTATISSKHLADIALRKIISLKAQEMKLDKKCNIISHMLQLNKKRTEIMDLINKNQFNLPIQENIEVYMQYFLSFMDFK